MTRPTEYVLAERLGQDLLRSGLKLATAESCTGGGLAHLVTSVPGSSAWFDRGYVTYSNQAKHESLGVDTGVLERHGAVSEQVAVAMAEGALHLSHADLSAAITGIAGPDGGSPEKPVGTVWFAWSMRGGETRTARANFTGDRGQVRQQSVLLAMQGLLDMLEAAV